MQSRLINEGPIKRTDSNKWILKNESRSIIGYPNHLKSLRPKMKKDEQDLYDMMKILSHDIRSPLVTIGAALKLLKKGSYGALDEGVCVELDKLLEIVVQATRIMEDFMGRVFSLSGTSDMHHEILDIRKDIADPVIFELEKRIQEKGIVIFNDDPGPGAEVKALTAGDSFLLKAVFRNLIHNAIRYGGKGCIMSYSIKNQASFHKITVFNSGRPIPDEEQNKLFNKFCSIKRDPNSANGGMGVGLYFAKEIVQKHGGRIWYEACKNGSKFIFTLPCIKEWE